jgi:hypothetical protein
VRAFLTSALGGCEWSDSRPGRIISGGKGAPDTHWIGGWVGPRADLDAVAKKNPIIASAGNVTPVDQPVT